MPLSAAGMDLVEQAEAREAEARTCFLRHDSDGSNTIDANELTSALATLGLKNDSSDEDFRALVAATLKHHDANHDGVLQFEEFVAAYNHVAKVGPLHKANPVAPMA
jgi:Ca2+-binding EF-hand superfamily protein